MSSSAVCVPVVHEKQQITEPDKPLSQNPPPIETTPARPDNKNPVATTKELVSEPKAAVEATDPQFRCPLCLEILWEQVSTPCGHAFCLSCITESLLYAKQCPLCRGSLVGTK